MEKNKNNLGVRKGAWTSEEDTLLRNCIEKFGEGKWHKVPLRAGLNRCRKSCRLRWLNYLRPNLKRGYFTNDEVDLIQRLHKLLGNRWSLIAGRVPGRTANDVKNFWNTHILKKSKSKSSSSLAGKKKSVETKTLKSDDDDQEKSIIYKPRPWNFSKRHELHGKPSPHDNNLKNSTPTSVDLINNNNNVSSSQLPPEDHNWKNSDHHEFLNYNFNNIPCSLSEQEVDECIRWWLETEATPVSMDDQPVFSPTEINQKIAEFLP